MKLRQVNLVINWREIICLLYKVGIKIQEMETFFPPELQNLLWRRVLIFMDGMLAVQDLMIAGKI